MLVHGCSVPLEACLLLDGGKRKPGFLGSPLTCHFYFTTIQSSKRSTFLVYRYLYVVSFVLLSYGYHQTSLPSPLVALLHMAADWSQMHGSTNEIWVSDEDQKGER